MRKNGISYIGLIVLTAIPALCGLEGDAWSMSETYKTTHASEYRRLGKTLWWKKRPVAVSKDYRSEKIGLPDYLRRSPSENDLRYAREEKKYIEKSNAPGRRQARNNTGFRRVGERLWWRETPSTATEKIGSTKIGLPDTPVRKPSRSMPRVSPERKISEEEKNLLERYHRLKKEKNNQVITVAEFKNRRLILMREKSPSAMERGGDEKEGDIIGKYRILKKLKRDKVITDSEFKKRRLALIHEVKPLEKKERIQVAAYSRDDEYGDFHGSMEGKSYRDSPDTYEKFNRAMFRFNSVLFDNVWDPVAKGYTRITPQAFRSSVKNFLSNLATPVRLLSSIIQGSWEKSGRVLSRFLINTTVGIGGLFDVAKTKFHINKVDEDFGQALGYHGVKSGSYLVWPFFGPSTVRGTVGLGVDTVMNPTWLLSPGMTTNIGITAGGKTNEIAQNPDLKAEIDEMAIDPYLTVRDLYLQHRHGKVKE